jgi:hypothetical protein
MVFRAFRRRLGGLRNRFRADLRKLRRDQPSGLPFIPFILIKGLNYVVLYAQIAILKAKIKVGIVPDPFPAVPVFLRVVIRRFQRYANQREALYIRSAIAVVAYYVNLDTPSGRGDSFLEIKPIPGTNIADPTYVLRLGLIAETLFLLRASDGFDEFCWRLRERDLRAAFYEAFAARLFFDAQFQIHARPETYIKGDDFDFWATKGQQRVNVEVTTLAEKRFSQKTIPNSLNKKRQQLPDTAPAVIVVGLPNQWMAEKRDWNSYLLQVSNNFFRGSKKINAIVFLQEQFYTTPTGFSALFVIQLPCRHPQPRMEITDISFLAAKHSEIRLLRDSEFFRWINYIVPLPEKADGR